MPTSQNGYDTAISIIPHLWPLYTILRFQNTYNINNKLDMLRDHKTPPIRRIRISDFGLPDPKRDLDRHQNCITWSLSHALPLQKISSKSVHKFAVIRRTDRQTGRQTDKQADRQTNRQTDRQTDRTENITSFFGGGNELQRLEK